MTIRKSLLLTTGILINIASLAQSASTQNFSSLQLPSGSGYFWCDVTPLAKKNPKATELIAINEKNLKSNAAYVATNCVDVSGMVCGGWRAAAAGTLQTDMWFLKNHFFKYDKAGMKFNQDDPTCQTDYGVVQIRVDYDYNLQCYVSQTLPPGLSAINKPIC